MKAAAALLALFALTSAPTAPAPADEIDLPLPDPVNARTAAMGGAGAALLDGGVGFFHNPAHLAVGEGVLFFGQTNLTGRAGVRFDPKGASYRWRGWGAAWGNKIAIADDVFDVTYLSAGRRIGTRGAIGASGKFWRKHPSERFQALGSDPTADIGALLTLSDNAAVGARASQLNRGAGFERIAAGASMRWSALLLAAEIENAGARFGSARFGLEWNATRRFAVQAGYGGGEPRAGFTARFGPIGMQTAWMRLRGETTLFVQMNAALIDIPEENSIENNEP